MYSVCTEHNVKEYMSTFYKVTFSIKIECLNKNLPLYTCTV